MQDPVLSDGSIGVSTWRDHVVLCGLGTVGMTIAESLLRAGARVAVVDNGPVTPFRQSLAEHGVPVIEGECTHLDTLRSAGTAQAQAVIVVISNDMVCMQTALAARELNPRARIVIRLFNLRTAHLLHDLPAGITALSLSATVAPVFTLAARCPALRGAFTLAGSVWAIGSLIAPAGDAGAHSLEQWRRLGLVVLACTASDGRFMLCPPPSYIPLPGSDVLVGAPPDRLEALSGDPASLDRALRAGEAPARLSVQPNRGARRSRTPLTDALRALRRFWRNANRVLRLALVGLLALVAASVVAFAFFYPLHPVDALYFTVELVTTVGLGDFNLQHASIPLKLFGVFVMLGGALLMAVVYGLLAEFLLNSRIEALLGEHPDEMRGHYVVAGLGAVGFRVVSALHEAGEQVVGIDSSASGRFVPQLRALEVPLVIGDAALEETLARAQISRARAFIAATSTDLVNIEAVLNAQAMRPDGHVVLRVFDPALAVQVRRGLGIPSSFSSSQIGAPAFISAALGHDALQVLSLPVGWPSEVATQRVLVLHLQAGDGDDLCGRRIDEVATTRGGTALLYLQAGTHDSPRFAPPSDQILAAGDRLVLAIPEGGHHHSPADAMEPEAVPAATSAS